MWLRSKKEFPNFIGFNARSEGRQMQHRVLAVPPSLHFWHSLYETVVLENTEGWGLLTVGRPHYEEIIYILSYRMWALRCGIYTQRVGLFSEPVKLDPHCPPCTPIQPVHSLIIIFYSGKEKISKGFHRSDW